LDISNITFVEGDTGIIVIDPLVSTEVAAAALGLYRTHRGGDRPVVAVIYTHSHVDHFGGVLGVTSQADVDAGTVAVLAPEGFTAHAVQENVYAGPAMTRRATYMYGSLLARGPQAQVGCGLGQAASTGEIAVIVPTVDIRTTGETHTIDGVQIEFQMAPGTEAPAEMHFYFPRFRALCMAENATHNLHNLLTLRGALVRDPHAWSGYLTEAIDTFADRTDVVFASHHWPTWERENIVEFMSLQRDMYAYLHDQTLRLLNQGYTGAEIAEMFQMPPALEQAWHTHGYYGSVSHNVKAVYQRYMGWFDGNPARLWPHPPEALATRYVAAIGGIDRVVELAKSAFDSGDFRWAATLLDHAVFADSEHAAARALYSDTLEQLAYGAENATWRNFFLSGATELRDGNFGTAVQVASPTMLSELTPEQIFDSLAIRINGPRSWDLDLAFDVTFADSEAISDANYRLTLRNGVLVYREIAPDPASATVTVRLSGKARLLSAAFGDFTSPGLELTGDETALQSLLGALDAPDPSFNIITP
jgi:alkyl sulfatase BDS1-like metallo-beta-lactamase superfamily hydrolase